MSEYRPKRKVEFIESYWTGGEHGADYVWNDNHREMIRCKDCYRYKGNGVCNRSGIWVEVNDDWFCADGERRDGDG